MRDSLCYNFYVLRKIVLAVVYVMVEIGFRFFKLMYLPTIKNPNFSKLI